MGCITCIAFSPDGNLLASASDDSTVKFWNPHTGELLRSLKQETINMSIAFSPNGALLAISSSLANNPILCDTRTGDRLHILEGHGNSINCVTFSPNGSLFATASDDGSAKLWNPHTGTCLHTLRVNAETVTFCTFSHDGNYLAIACEMANYVQIWNTQTGELHSTLNLSKIVSDIAFSPNGYFLAIRSACENVQLWDINTKTCIRSLKESHADQGITFSPDGSLLTATSSLNKTVYLWNVFTSQITATLTNPNGFQDIAFSPDGNSLASGDYNGMVTRWYM